jgi:hypothetical protein
MSVPMSQVLATARTYLNDDNSTQFPDPVLIPKVQEAHRELQEELWVGGSPNVRALTPVLHYVANATVLPALPAGFLCPMMGFENAWPTPAAPTAWAPMTEAFYLPLGAAQGPTLGFWQWQQETITLTGATADRSVLFQYRSLITIPILATDLIGILFGESFLSARTAAIAAGTVGNAEVYAAMTALAKENLAKVLTANRGQQKPLLKP